MSKSTYYIRICIGLLLSFIVVRIFSQTIFIENTPQIKLEYLARMPSVLFEVVKGPARYVASLFHSGDSPLAPAGYNAQNTIFTPLSKGVYAGEDKITRKKYIKLDKNVQLNVTEYEFEGKKIVIYEPISQ